MTIEFNLIDQAATERFARALGTLLRPTDFVALEGDLGAGKTTLARALIQGLNPAETEVPSPTFTLVQVYETPKGPLAHLDLYRLSDPEEIYALGWDDLRQGIMLVEWPVRLGTLLPRARINATLAYGQQEGARLLTLDIDEERRKALQEILGNDGHNGKD